MDKSEVISALEEITVLMELKGENPFKIRAYSNAARILQGLSEDFETIVRENRLTELKGIGKGIAEFIRIYIETGKSEGLDLLRQETPPGIIEMLKIPGMGPKKIKAVREKLTISNIRELEYACSENRLVELEGFGLKTQQKIVDGIKLIKKYSERHLLSEMIPAAENILSYLSKNPDVIRCDIAGSLRRWKETAKDIDLLASALPVKHDSVMEYFTSLPSVEAVVAKGKAKSSIRLENGIIAELRIVEDSQFPYALHHLTGSSEHNIALRQYAGKMKLNMNEYGLFDQEGNNIGCKDEQDIFQQLKLEYIPPELRENRGEIEAASSGELPILITQSDIRGMIHVHSNYSDGISTISELAEACRAQGFSYLVISDHSRSAAYAGGLSVERIHQQISEIDQINKSFSDFRILKSIESDILSDGRLDYEEDVLKLFDLVIASIHSRLNMSQSEATDRIIKAMENPFLTILGHPTGRLLLAREGYPVDMKAVIEAAATLNVALELNSNPHRLDTDWRYLKQAKEQGVKISINPDAHRIEGFQDIRYGIGIARKGWLSSGDVLNCMTSEDIIRFARNRRN